MKTVLVGQLFLAGLALNQAQVHNWKNDFTQPLDFTCPNGQIIGYMYSIYNSTYFYDRVWEIGCRSVLTTSDCNQTDWINNWDDQYFIFNCPRDKLLSGVGSVYDSSSKDRRYKFTCCLVNSKPINNNDCEMSYVSMIGTPLDYTVPDGFGIFRFAASMKQETDERRIDFAICPI